MAGGQSAQKGPRLDAIDGWRGIGCLIVALFHLNAAHSFYFSPWLHSATPVLELFFVISGFVMSLAFAKSINGFRGAASYITRIFVRLFSLHWVTLAMLVALASAKALAGAQNGGFYGGRSLEYLPAQIFNVQTWVGQGMSWNYPAWTLSGEMAAYISFAVVMMLIQNKTWRLVAAALMFVVSSALFLRELGPRDEYNVISVTRCFVGFYFGFMLHALWSWRRVTSKAWINVLEVVAVLALVLSIAARLDGPAYFLNYLIVGLIVFIFATGEGVVSRAITIPPLMWLGKVSFSLYMIHAVIKIAIDDGFRLLERVTDIQFFFWFERSWDRPVELISLGSVWANNLLLAAYLIAVFIGAHILYKVVEEPMRKVGPAWSKKVIQAPPGTFTPQGLLGLARTALGRRKAEAET